MSKRTLIVGIAVVVLLGTAGAASAVPGGTERPFKADLVGEILFELGAPECAAYGPVRTHTESWGTATHMGRVQATWAHCPQQVGNTNGLLTIVAANGDELYLAYEDTTPELSFPIDIVGGTGRFDAATGSGVVTYAFTPVFLPGCEIDPNNPIPCFDLSTPWDWAGSIEGMIGY